MRNWYTVFIFIPQPFCSTAVPLSSDAMNRSYVDILFFCTAGCSSADTSFFYKVENTSLGMCVSLLFLYNGTGRKDYVLNN